MRAGLLVCCCDGSELGDKAQGSQDNLNLEEKRATFSRHFLKTVRAGDFSSVCVCVCVCVCVSPALPPRSTRPDIQDTNRQTRACGMLT